MLGGMRGGPAPSRRLPRRPEDEAVNSPYHRTCSFDVRVSLRISGAPDSPVKPKGSSWLEFSDRYLQITVTVRLGLRQPTASDVDL